MKVLFIGGTGRLSKDPAILAVEKGYDVYLLVRGSKDRELFVNKKQHLIISDIQNDPESCRRKIEDQYFDVVVDFLSYNKDQLISHLAILSGKYKQYIFISSATVYDDCNDALITEEKTSIGNSKWDYAQNKYECEKYIDEYFKNKETNTVYTIVRPYVTYGETRIPFPIVPLNNVYEWSLIDRIINDQTIVIFDHGQTVTTITHTRDFAEGLVGLFRNKKAYNETFHITDNKCVTLGEVISILGEILNKKVSVCDVSQDVLFNNISYYKELITQDKGITRKFDNHKICSAVPELSFDVDLKDGLKEVIQFYESHPDRKKIDYKWMAEIDRLCWREKHHVNRRNYQFPTRYEKVLYYTERYPTIKKIIKMKNNIFKG